MGFTNNMRGDQMTPWMKLRAFLTIFGGLLIHLALGGQYTFGNAMPYLISYLKYRAGEPNVRNVDSLWFNAAAGPVQVVAFMVGGVLHRRFGARITTAIGAIIYSASTFLIYFAVKKSFIAMAFTQSVMSSVGSAIAYGGSLAVAMQWFPQRSGLAGGIILAGYGGSSSIINQIITLYINPDNLSPDVKEGSERYFSDVALLNRVPTCYLILGVIYTALQIFGVLLLFSPPSSDENKIVEVCVMLGFGSYVLRQTCDVVSDVGRSRGPTVGLEMVVIVKYNKTSNKSFDGNGKDENKTDEAPVEYCTIDHEKHDHIEMKQSNSTEEVEEGNAKQETGSSGGNAQADPTVLQLIKQMVISRNFYVFSIILFSVSYGNLTISTLYKAYGQTFIFNDHFLALVGSLSSVFNCIGRPFWGAIMDYFRFKVAIQCITAGTACLLMTIIASEWVGETFFAIWVCAVYLCVCGTYSTVPASLSRLYGVSNLGITYGLAGISMIATGIISAVMGTTLRDVIGWHGEYLLGGGVTALGFVASFFFIDEDSEQK